MRTRLLAGLIAASLALAACGGSDDGSVEATSSPTEQLAFSADTVTGETVDASDYVGSDLVIWFWAPW